MCGEQGKGGQSCQCVARGEGGKVKAEDEEEEEETEESRSKGGEVSAERRWRSSGNGKFGGG